MLDVVCASPAKDISPKPSAPVVWVTWAEGIAGPATLAPRGEFRCFLVFSLAPSAMVAAQKAEMTLGWQHLATQSGTRLDPERLSSLPEEFHEICEAAMSGQTGVMHYCVNRRSIPLSAPPI